MLKRASVSRARWFFRELISLRGIQASLNRCIQSRGHQTACPGSTTAVINSVTNRPATTILLKYHRLVPIQQNAILHVPSHRSPKYDFLEVAALLNQILNRIAMGY